MQKHAALPQHLVCLFGQDVHGIWLWKHEPADGPLGDSGLLPDTEVLLQMIRGHPLKAKTNETT